MSKKNKHRHQNNPQQQAQAKASKQPQAEAAPASVPNTRVFVPRDAAALSMGANTVAKAIASEAGKRNATIEIVRNGSRGMLWLEPLVEVETAKGRVALRAGRRERRRGPVRRRFPQRRRARAFASASPTRFPTSRTRSG